MCPFAFSEKRIFSGSLRKVLTLSSSSGLNQLIGILAVPVLTRVYSPIEFGLYGLFLAILSVGTVFTTWKYERGLMICHSKSERQGLFGLALIISFVFSLLVFSGSYLWRKGLSDHNLSLTLVISNWNLLLALSFFFAGSGTALRFLALKEKAFALISVVGVCSTLVRIIVQLAGVFESFFTATLLPLGHVLSLGCITFLLGWTARVKHWLDFRRYPFRFERMVAAARRNSEFPKYMVWSAFSNNITPQVLVLMASQLFSPAIVGQFFLAERVLKSPTLLLATSVAEVNFQELSETNPSVLAKIYRSRLKKMLVIGAPPSIILMLISTWLFPAVFGDSWKDAGILAKYMVPGIYFQFSFMPFHHLFTILREQRLFLFWSLSRLLLMISCVYLGALTGMARGAAIGHSFALIVSYLLGHLLLQIPLNRVTNNVI